MVSGWYHNGTWAKAKTIMRAKIRHLVTKKESIDDAKFTRLVAIPEELNENNWHLAQSGPDVPAEEIDLLADFRFQASLPLPSGAIRSINLRRREHTSGKGEGLLQADRESGTCIDARVTGALEALEGSMFIPNDEVDDGFDDQSSDNETDRSDDGTEGSVEEDGE